MQPRFSSFAMALLASTPAFAQNVYLNEIYASHAGTDTQEFVELIGTPGASLANVMLLVVEGDGASSGTLDRAYDLSAFSIPADGFFVLGTAGVVARDFDLGASDALENGTETFVLLNATSPAAVAALVGTSVKTAPSTTSLATLGTVLDSVGIVDSGYPATDEIFDGATFVGPDGTFFPPGIYRNADHPRGWSSTLLEFDLDAVADPYAPRTPGAKNPPSSPWVRISEYMYNGEGDEFIEFTNIGSLPADLTGWSYDDDSNLPGVQPLSAYGTIAAGEVVVLTESTESTFRSEWGVPASVKVIGNLTANLGQNDRINLFAPNGYQVDRLDFGPTKVPGSYKTQYFSAWAPSDAIGKDQILLWSASIAGDIQGTVASANGDLGNPGVHVATTPCADWFALGNAKDTSADTTPVLVGKGTQQDGSLISLVILEGTPSALSLICVGFTNVGVPFPGGGILVPSPEVTVILPVDSLGNLTLTTTWPAGVPSGIDLYYQVLFADAGVPGGIAATNAYRSTTP